MAQENSSDDDWPEDCPICKSVGSTCETHCINLVTEICNNATELFENDGEDTSALSFGERLLWLEEKLNQNERHQQLREHDITGVCANVTSDLPEASEQVPDDGDVPANPPQDDQLNNVGNPPQDDQNIPGMVEMIANMQIDAGEEPSALLQSMLNQDSIDDNDFQNDVERAIYVINALHCVYNGSFRRLSEAQVMSRMNYTLQFIQQRVGLVIPANITTILYTIFTNSDEDDEDDAVDNAGTFDQLGQPFGQAYRILTRQNADEGDDNNNDDDEVDDDLGDGNNDIVVVDDDEDEYYVDASDTSGSWYGSDDSDDDEDSESEEEAADSESEEEEEIENERRRVRRRRT